LQKISNQSEPRYSSPWKIPLKNSTNFIATAKENDLGANYPLPSLSSSPLSSYESNQNRFGSDVITSMDYEKRDGTNFTFIHEDPRFKTFIKSCSEENGIDPAHIEKDYYVSHALWCLRKKGLDIQIKGGVSLSKGFGVIHRLSEDVDIIVFSGNACSTTLQDVLIELENADMKNKFKTPERCVLWRRLGNLIKKPFPGMHIRICGRESPFYDPQWIHLSLQATYKNQFSILNDDLLPPQIVMELSTGKDEPLEPIPLRLSSFLHDSLEKKRILYQFKRNIPTVLCTHPMITLIQKISDGIMNRYQRPVSDDLLPPYASGLRGRIPPFDPRIVRHYEDAASIIVHIDRCHPLQESSQYRNLFSELMKRRMLRRKLEDGTTIHDDDSFRLLDKDKVNLLELCQQQRKCLYYADLSSSSSFSSTSTSPPSSISAFSSSSSTIIGTLRKFSLSSSEPPSLESCAQVIREWLQKVGL